jgi:hypothetical protein
MAQRGLFANYDDILLFKYDKKNYLKAFITNILLSANDQILVTSTEGNLHRAQYTE